MAELKELLNNKETIDFIKKLIENTENIIIIINNNHRIEYISQKCKKYIGFDSDELTQKPIKSIIYHEDQDKLQNLLKKIRKDKDSKIEIRLINKNGGFIWYFLKGKEIQTNRNSAKTVLFLNNIFKTKDLMSKKGKLKESDFYESLSEVSFWKLLQPKQRVSALEESLEMLQFVLDQMPQYIAWKDKDLTFLGCNINFARVIGLNKPGKIIGKSNEEIYHKDDIKQYLNKKEENIINSKNPELHNIEDWFRIDDEIRYFDASRLPLRDLAGNVIGILMAYEDITERIKAKKALESSEKRFRKLNELLPDIVYTVNRKGIITYVNSVVHNILGYEPDEISNKKHISEFFPKEHLDFLRSNFNKVIEGAITEAHEYEMIKKDGSKIYVMLHSRPLYKDGEITGLLGIIHDISKLLEAEQKLIESEKKYRTLAQSLPIIIYEFDKDLKLTYVNNFGVEKFGLNKEDYKNQKITEFIAPLDFNDALSDIKEIFKGKNIEPKDVLLQKIDGSYFYGRSHVMPIYKDHEIIGLRGIISDITERKKSEITLKKEIEERKKTEEKLKKSEEKYRYLFEGSPLVIWLVQLDGTIIDCNTTTNKLLANHTKEDLIGNNFIEILSLLDKSDYFIPFFKKRFSKIREGEKLDPTEVLLKRGDGTSMWLNVIGSLIKLGDETLVQVIIQDITENKKAQQKIKESQEKLKILNKELEQKVVERTKELKESEEKLRKQNIELRRLDNLKNEFIQNAAHELKTPLISISGYTDYLLMKHKDNIDSEVKNDLAIIKKNVKRLENLMNQLFEVMKIDDQKLKLKKEKVQIRHLVEECIKDLSYQIKEKNHNILLDIENQMTLNVDPERISQVFTNLISNAIKFTKENGIIKISGEEKDNHKFLFKVEDNGLGLSEDEIKRLFRKFERIKSPLKHEIKYRGTGLGLYICKGIINSHGGEIWAESPGLNKGTKIFFTIPQD
ncbi:MAG: PAS domain S-box protein [Promethearchaeati archaeon]